MDERDFDHAEMIAAAERDSSVARASRAVAQSGTRDCADCGAALSEARRFAAPFATRCLACQMARERRALRHAV